MQREGRDVRRLLAWEGIVHRDHKTNYHSLEMLTRHQGTVTLVFRVILVKVDYRGRENGEEDTESDDDDVTNTRWKGSSATKVGLLTLKLRMVSPRWGADVDAFDRDGTSGHDCSR